ncbi:hypothetical protein E3N88_23097 [Mikania micrantha]|uniref:Uncharacterized protein n=1 Tax=Mikania micrantha TaxID=192012 RepID=A0A5N6NCB2_9ASTR|nr:hypothetical protein E3N88_23097 [Mikania micrantha]
MVVMVVLSSNGSSSHQPSNLQALELQWRSPMASQVSNQLFADEFGRDMACTIGEMMKSGVNRHGGLDFIKICRLAPVAYRDGCLKESSRTATDFGSQTPAMPVASRGLKRDIRAKKKGLQPQGVASVPDNCSSSSKGFCPRKKGSKA